MSGRAARSARRTLGRRAWLRGAGGVAIALPFLQELGHPKAQSEGPTCPPRLVTLFFGLGLDPAWQGDFDTALAPLRPFRDKMATFSVDLVRGGGGAHCNTASVVFVGEEPRSVSVSGGPSLDQWVRQELDPSGATLASGLWWRRGACAGQALRVYQADGSARSPIKRPSEVFDRLFGTVVPPPDDPPDPPDDPMDPPTDPMDPPPVDPEVRREARIRRSILDTVMDQYRHYTGDRSPLGRESRLKIEQHLASIREIERQLAPADELLDRVEPSDDPANLGGDPTSPATCATIPDEPTDPELRNGGTVYDYDEYTYGTGSGAPVLDYRDVQEVFRLHADLWAVALRCDLVRFGNLMFESAGGHTNLDGTYSALGRSTSFPGSSQHDAYFHGGDRQTAQLYQHFAMSNLAYFLDLLDDRDFPEADGRTVLENVPVVIGTEYGWNHSANDAFTAVVGGTDRYRSGIFTGEDLQAIDVYNAILEGFAIDARIGSRTGVASKGDAGRLLLR